MIMKKCKKQKIKVFKPIQDQNYYLEKIPVDSVTLKCMLQKSAVDEIFWKLTNEPNFPLHFYLETPQHLADYFLHFSKKLLDLNPTTCKHPILSNINPTFLFQPSEKPNEFPASNGIRSIFNLN